jgi:hypothetical protein
LALKTFLAQGSDICDCPTTYAGKDFINIWQPTMIAIVIKSKTVASSYKKHFDLPLQLAKKV